MARPTEPSPERASRVMALTDGVFAIALTLIVLEIHLPLPEAVNSEAELASALLALAPRFLTYAISFLTLTIFWFGQQAQHELVARMDRRLATLHLLFLGFIALLPFSTDLLAEFLAFRLAIVVYWLNMLALGASLYASWSYARRHGFLVEEATIEVQKRVAERIVRAQLWWAIGALVSIVSPLLSICVIFLIQIIYAVAPPWAWTRRFIG